MHGVTDLKRRMHFYGAHGTMDAMAAVHSMEEFVRTANLPFNDGPTLNNGSTIHVDGAKVHGKVFHERMQRQGFKIYVASPCKKLTNYMYG